MEIFAYGEDALTLWAMQNKLSVILNALEDSSDPSHCQVFFRPSFGRKGGKDSSQFGEFDFILLSEKCIYLGESKWDRSSEKNVGSTMMLREEQLVRHKVFRFYVEEWAFGDYQSWEDLQDRAMSKLQSLALRKTIAPSSSLLATNLQTVLGVIKRRYKNLVPICDVLLYLHSGVEASVIPQYVDDNFLVIPLDYSEDIFQNFIKLS